MLNSEGQASNPKLIVNEPQSQLLGLVEGPYWC